MPENISSQFHRLYPAPIEDNRVVETILERDSIPGNVRWEGMHVYVSQEGEKKTYELRGGITNDFWEPISDIDIDVAVDIAFSETSTNPVQNQVITNGMYQRTQLQTSGQAQVHWDNLTNVPDLVEESELSNYQLRSEKGQANGYVPLGSNQLIPSQYLPPLAITHTFVVASQSEMLALNAQTGDVAVRTDLNNSFILQSEPASSLGNWVELLTPGAPVQSVNGETGTVQLDPSFSGGQLSITGSSSVNLDSRYYTETEIDGLLNDKIDDAVESIPDLINYTGEGNTVIVSDTIRGGVFVYKNSGTVDGGTVFEATGKGSGYWHRIYNEEDGLNVLWYGVDNSGLTDNSDLLKDIIYTYAEKNSKIYFPAGVYSISSQVGVTPTNVSETEYITHDITLIGDKGAILKASDDIPSQIGAVIGVDVAGVDVTVIGLEIDANSKANRGLYIRDANPNFEQQSRAQIEGVTVHNTIRTVAEGVENSSSGMIVYGRFMSVEVKNCEINNVQGDSGSVLNGIRVGGTDSAQDAYPTSIRILDNRINTVSKDVSVWTDQDGIGVLIPKSAAHNPDFDGSCLIHGNTIINCPGRFVKVQHPNAIVSENVMTITDAFEMPNYTQVASCIDFQYGSGVAKDNYISYNNTIGNTHLATVFFNKDTPLSSRMICSGNKVFSINPISHFVRFNEVSEYSAHNSNLVVKDNEISGSTLNFLLHFSGYSGHSDPVRFSAHNNRIENAVGGSLINSAGRNIDVSAIFNSNAGSPIPFTNNPSGDNFFYGNIGFTGTNNPLTVDNLGFGLSWNSSTNEIDWGTSIDAGSGVTLHEVDYGDKNYLFFGNSTITTPTEDLIGGMYIMRNSDQNASSFQVQNKNENYNTTFGIENGNASNAAYIRLTDNTSDLCGLIMSSSTGVELYARSVGGSSGDVDISGSDAVQLRSLNGIVYVTGQNEARVTSQGDITLTAVSGTVEAPSSDIKIGANQPGTHGIILISPDATEWRVTVDNSGTLTTTAL